MTTSGTADTRTATGVPRSVTDKKVTSVVAIAGGGTGGHVYPALEVAEALRETASSGATIACIWIGSRGGFERSVVESRDLRYYGISTGKLRRYFSIRNFADLFRIVGGMLQSIAILRRERPALLFAKGGYVSVPPVIAARMLGIPVVCHESDLDPGLATRINSRFADLILIPYEASRRYYQESAGPRLRVTGVPVRRDLLFRNTDCARVADETVPMLLVLGGSQGARRINEFVVRHLDTLLDRWRIVHQTGASGIGGTPRPGYTPVAYLTDEYAAILDRADCVLCRSGATTLWECGASAKPMVLVPLGLDASRGDQIRNARYFAERHAAIVCEPGSAQEEEMLEALQMLSMQPDERELLGRNARNLVRPDGAETIARLIVTLIEKKGVHT